MYKPTDFEVDEIVVVLQKGKEPTRGKVVGRTKEHVRIWKMEDGMYIRVPGDPYTRKRFLIKPNQLRKIPKEQLKLENEKRIRDLKNYF